MKYIDDHDAAKKKSNKDAGINDGDDEEMFDAEPSEPKSELTLLQVGLFCSLCQSSSTFHPYISLDAVCILSYLGSRHHTCYNLLV